MTIKAIRKISIIGMGFMGASLALSIKKKLPWVKIVGYAHRRGLLTKLKKFSAVDFATTDLPLAVNDSELIILAAPVGVIIDYFSKIKSFVKPGSYIIDLGSTKVAINKAAKANLPKKACFVGCHPLAGSEKKGLENAVENLYQGSICIITAKSKKARLIYDFWQKLGCRTHYLSAIAHDKVLGVISHLPHIIAYALAGYTPSKYKKFSTRSYCDVTRISNSSAKVWTDILLSNRDNLIADIDGYVRCLDEIKKHLKSKDKDGLSKLIDNVNRRRGEHQR
jgi:prephenate dehydrogenase